MSESVDQQDVITPFTGGGTAKNNQLLYAAGDVIVWLAPQNSAGPVTGFEDPSTLTPKYVNCGWVDTSGYIFKLDETIKDIPAAGTLTPIRTILTGGTKSLQCTFLEALNPYVLALYDNTPVFPVTGMAQKAASVTPFIASYVIPDPPGDNRYAAIFDSDDGIKQMRLWAPNIKVTARGNNQVQQADLTTTDLTFTFYPGTGNVVAKRYIDYGQNVDTYFT